MYHDTKPCELCPWSYDRNKTPCAMFRLSFSLMILQTFTENDILPCLCCCLNTVSLWTPLTNSNPQSPQLCPSELKPKPEHTELSQLLNLSTHSQRYPLKINHAGKPPFQTLASYVSTHAPHSAGSSLETLWHYSRKQMWEWQQSGMMLH